MITRLDLLLVGFWQILLIFNVQLLMPIFLNYMPAQKCDGLSYHQALCYDVRGKCNQCVDKCNPQQSICLRAGVHNESCFRSIRERDFFHSAAEEYGYFCNPHLRFIRVDTLQYVGALIGTIAFGTLADSFGRRRVLLIALGIGLLSLLLSGEMGRPAWFFLFRFILGLCNGAGLTVGWSYVTELIAAKKRTLLRVLSSWPLARLIMTLAAFATGEWRMTTRTIVLLGLPLIPILYFLLPESHIWLAIKGRSKAYCESVYRLNWIAGCAYVKKSELHCKAAGVGLKEGLEQIFIRPVLRKRMLLLLSLWFSTFYALFVLDLNSDVMYKQGFWAGQFALCGLLVGAKFMWGLLEQYMPAINRRRMHLVAQAGAVFSVLILMILYFNGLKGSTGFMLLWLLASVCVDICSDVCYLALNELMPVEVRGAAFGASSIAARVAMVASTFTTAIKDSAEPALYVSIIVLGVATWLASYFFFDDAKSMKDLKELDPKTAPPPVIPTIHIEVFDNVNDNGSIRSYATDFKPFETKEEETSKEQKEEAKPAKEIKDDLSFGDLIFWTTSASNPSYDPTAPDAADEDGEASQGLAAASDADTDLPVCKDGLCNLRGGILDAEEVNPVQEEKPVGLEAKEGDNEEKLRESQEGKALSREEKQNGDNEHDQTVIRF